MLFTWSACGAWCACRLGLLLCDPVVMPAAEHGHVIYLHRLAPVPLRYLVGFEP